MDPATLHRRTVESWELRVEAVPTDRWESPTPCSGWDVRTLVNHVTGEEAVDGAAGAGQHDGGGR